MFVKEAADILFRAVTALSEDVRDEQSKIRAMVRSISSYPLKILASFIAAPVLMVRIAWTAENPVRRIVAVVGLLSSLALSYLAGTFLGTLVGAWLVASQIGILVGIGFLFGTTLSIYLSVLFSIVVFNAVSFIFLKMSSQEILDYLRKL